MKPKKKPINKSKTSPAAWGAFTVETDAARLTRLRQDMLRELMQGNRPYGKDQTTTRAEMELWAKDAVVIADIIFVETK